MTAPVAAPPESAADFYSRGQRIVATALLALRDRMRLFRASDIDGSFARLQPDLVAILAATQTAAATSAANYIPVVLDELGITAPAVAAVQPAAFIGASSGVTLQTLFGSIPVEAKVQSAAGLDFTEIEDRAATLLEGMFETQIADASRSATSVGTAARPALTGYVRMVSGNACGRCLVLAGRFYRYNADFLRHPRCHCYGVPSTRSAARGMTFSPEEAFAGLSPAQQDKAFGKANARAIREGADIARVVNATGRRAGMTTTVHGAKLTYEGTKATGGKLRLTPEAIYRFAGSRDEELRLLRSQGYLA